MLVTAYCNQAARGAQRLAAWEQAGLPVERGRERWSLERQVRGVAGRLVLAGALGGLLFAWRPSGALAAAISGGLLYSALTDTCGMAALLARLPYNRGGAAMCAGRWPPWA